MHEQKKILVVDDSDENREGVVELLDALGYAVENASNGREALEKVKNFQPHIFLLDVKMPEMDGLALLHELHVEDNSYEAIMMTGHESLEDAKKAMELGAFSYLTKPLNRHDLEEHIRKAFAMVKLKQARFDHLVSLQKEVESQTKELEKSLQIMKSQANRIDAIISSMSEGLLAIDNDENIVLVNDEAQRILRITFSASLSQNIWKVLENKKIVEHLRQLITESHLKKTEGYLQLPNNTGEGIRYFWVTVSPVFGDGGASIGKIVNFIDQTEKVKADELRNSFLSIVAHELRTPITILMSSSTVLELDNKNEENRNQAVADIKTTSNRLKYLVNNIINIAVLSDPVITVRCEDIDMYNLIYCQFEKLRYEAKEKNVSFSIKSKLENQLLYTDSKYLSIAVNCLLHNAIKFNKDNGTITVNLDTKKDKNKNRIAIRITDEGIGMSEDERMHLFESFYQAEDPLTRHYGGIGIGLFLAKRAMGLLQGNILVDTEKGKGSAFTLEIPQ